MVSKSSEIHKVVYEIKGTQVTVLELLCKLEIHDVICLVSFNSAHPLCSGSCFYAK